MNDTNIENLLREALEAEMALLPKQHYQRTPECLKTWRLDTGIQTGWTAAERKHLESKCPYCLKMVTFAEDNPSREMAAIPFSAPKPRVPLWRTWWVPTMAAAACAMIAAVIYFGILNRPDASGAPRKEEITHNPSATSVPKLATAPQPKLNKDGPPPLPRPQPTPSNLVTAPELALRFEGAGEARTLGNGTGTSDPILRIQAANPPLRIVLRIPSEDLGAVGAPCLLGLEVGGKQIRQLRTMPVRSGNGAQVEWRMPTAGLAQEDYRLRVSGCTADTIHRQFRVLRGVE